MDRLGEPRESLVEWRAGLPSEQSFEACVTIGCSLSTFDTTESFLQHDFVYGAFGIHPLSAEDWTPEVESRVEALVKVANPPSLATAKLALTIVSCNPRGRASVQHIAPPNSSARSSGVLWLHRRTRRWWR